MKIFPGLMLAAALATPATGQVTGGEAVARYEACLTSAAAAARRSWMDMEAYEGATGPGCAGLREAFARAASGPSHGRDGAPPSPDGNMVGFVLRYDMRDRRDAGLIYARDWMAAHAGIPGDGSLASARADLLICLEGVYQTFQRPHVLGPQTPIAALREAAEARTASACEAEARTVANGKAAELARINGSGGAPETHAAEASVYVGDIRHTLNRRYDRWWQEALDNN